MGTGYIYPIIDFTLLDYTKIPTGTYLLGFDENSDGSLSKIDSDGIISILEGGSGGSNPIGAADGDLSGSYPNPSVAWNNGLSTYDLSYYQIPAGTISQYIRGDGSFATFPTGLITGSGVATRVAFWDTASSLSSNSNLYWDNVNSRLGIGNNVPLAPIDLGSSTGSAGSINKLALYSSVYGTYGFGISPAQLDYTSGGAHVFYKNSPSISELFRIDNTGNLTSVSLIGTGTRMLITDSIGTISSQVIPTIPTVTPSALTKVDDTNVTLTLGGSPLTALLQSTSLTLGWTGTLADSRISSASTWNAKQDTIVLTTTGTSGPATLIGATLNIPQYGGGGGASIIKLTAQTLIAEDWVLLSDYYTYTFSNVNITINTRVDFTPDNSAYLEVTTCGMLPQVNVTAGSCTFYSLFPPQSNILGEITIIPTV